MTTAIAQFMRDLEGVWDQHRDGLLVRRDLAAAVAAMADEPSVTHIPALPAGPDARPSSASTPIRSCRTCPPTWR